MGWDFKKKGTAETLARMAREDQARSTGRMRDYKSGYMNQQILVKTPQDGIPARSEVSSTETARDEFQMGVAECKLLTTYDPTTTGGGERNQQTLHTVGRPSVATNEIDWRDNYTPVYVANPYLNAIAGNKIILAHYIDGSYVVAEPPASARTRIALKTSIIDGAATAWVLDQPTENEGEFAEMQVTDPRKQFYGAIGSNEPTRQDLSACSADLTYYAEKPGGIGWASYSPTSDSWEIESMTLPIQRFKAEVPGGVASPSQKFSGIENESAKPVFFNPEDSLSPYPHVDMPPEVMCNPGAENVSKKLMVQALNPHRFTIMPGSEVTIERRIKEVPASEYDATSYLPHDNAIPSTGVIRGYEWVIVDAEKTIARWAKFKTINGSQNCEWKYNDSASSFKEGHDPLKYFGSDVAPAVEDDVTVQAATDIGGCACDDGASQSPVTVPALNTVGWGFWDNNESKYNVVVTKSALLGPPECDFIKDISGGSGTGCNLGITKVDGQVGWDAGSSSSNIEISVSTREIKYMSGLSGGCNVICPTFEYATVLDCGANTGGYVSCMNIYADPCETCTGTCNWYWNGTDWEEDTLTPHACTSTNPDCGCEGQEPPPYESGPTTVTTSCAVYNEPPEPPPCQTCTLCENRDIQIDDVEYTAGILAPASYYTMVAGTSQRVGDCEWTVTVTWSEIGSADTNETATISFDGTTWTCSVPNSPQGTQGNWSYTPPGSPCSPGILQKLDDGVELVTSHPGQGTVTFGASGPLC